FPAHTWSVVNPKASRSELCTSSGQVLAVLPAGDIYVGAVDDGFVNLAGKQYRGWLQLTLLNGRFRVINYVDIEDYLLGVVPREMSPSQPLEALKVQAVASRTFALTSSKHRGAGFDVCTTTCCQVLDHSREAARSTQAVRETSGLVVTHKGKMAPVYFHAHSGGHTENPLYVWGNPVSYLTGVPELYPTNSSYDYWEERLTAAEIKQLLGQMGINVGSVLSVEPLSYTPAGRVRQLRIVGSAGSTILEREQIRLNLRLKSRVYTVKPDIPAVSVLAADGQVKALNPSGLKVVTASGVQTLQPRPTYYLRGANGQQRQTVAEANSYLFVGSGYGHGVGISQHGAYAMAHHGHTFEEIIKYYLSDVEIVKLGD
ncbi:MAG: SpoIID/LytB domain-containing protein, partial [Firmicutes bacterium]|nr:SpoIID/LytB domain-containing protein [Bacillota bacterium]